MMDSFPLTLVFALAGVIAVFAPLRWALALNLALCFMPFFRLNLPLGAKGVGIRPEDLVLLILFVRAILWTRPRPLPASALHFVRLYAGLLVLLFVGLGVSLAEAGLQMVSLYLVQKALGVTALLFVAHRVLRTREDCMRCLTGIVLGGVFLSAAVLLSDAPPQERGASMVFDREMYYLKDKQMQYLTEWNANVIGVSAGLLVLASLALATQTSRRFLWCVTILCAALFTYVLIHSYTRSALLASAIVFLWISFRLFRRLSARAAILLMAVVIVSLIALPNLRWEAFQLDFLNDLNTGSRLRIWATALEGIAARPFGYGAGLGDMAFNESFQARLSAHNDWLDFALDLGVLGGAWALATFLALGRRLARAARRHPGLTLETAGLAAFVFCLICSFSHQVFLFCKQPFAVLSVFFALANLPQRVLLWSLSPAAEPVPPPGGEDDAVEPATAAHSARD